MGLLDVDLCGPSAPRMVLGDDYINATVTKSASGAWTPVYSTKHPNLACMSISFLLQEHDSAVVWRGPRKNGLIQQFLTEVDWTGDTDGLGELLNFADSIRIWYISFLSHLYLKKNQRLLDC